MVQIEIGLFSAYTFAVRSRQKARRQIRNVVSRGSVLMGEWKKSPKGLRVLLPLGVGALALFAVTKGPLAEVSEIDAFQRAVSSQTKADALAFLKDFGSSHLVPDLIDLLQPDVALEVCSSLLSGSSRARAACDKVKQAIAVAPAAGSPTPPALAAVTPTLPGAAAVIPTPPTPAAVTPTLPVATAVIPTPPPAAVTPTPPPAAVTPTPLAATEETAPVAPSFVVAPPAGTLPAPAPAEQVAIVPLVEQDSGAAVAVKPSSANDNAETWRKLTTRFDHPPFAVEYVDRKRGQMVVTYSGYLGTFVACGDAIGAAKASLESGSVARNQLNSRMIIHLANGNGGSTSLSVDAIHIVALDRLTSRSPDVVNVRLDTPARTSDGRYCWSTGEMERLARLQ